MTINYEIRRIEAAIQKLSDLNHPYPAIRNEIKADLTRQAITFDEYNDLFKRTSEAESKQEAQRIVDEHRKYRT
jgi:hypothetical protein